MSVTFPRGFRASGVAAGMKPSGRPDLGLLVAERVTGAAGLFTTNAFAAAPVLLARRRVAGGLARAVVANSGQANAGTGPRGERDAESSSAAAAEALSIDPAHVVPCSTGVIGEPLHLDQYLAALPEAVGALGEDGGGAFARAIMTTDNVPKEATAEAERYRVGGCAKGVGMISPDLRLATMLTFLTTDASLWPEHARTLARDVLEPRFESLTVDGCSSTNDSVLLFASGAAGDDPVEPGSRGWGPLVGAVEEVADSLLRQLAEDAEGGTHVVLVEVSGAADEAAARSVARAVADSLLVKTAVFGGDPNPGRILQAVGASGARFDPSAVGAWIGDVEVIAGGAVSPSYHADPARAAEAIRAHDVVLSVSLGEGPATSAALGVDLSYDYVKINAEYTT